CHQKPVLKSCGRVKTRRLPNSIGWESGRSRSDFARLIWQALRIFLRAITLAPHSFLSGSPPLSRSSCVSAASRRNRNNLPRNGSAARLSRCASPVFLYAWLETKYATSRSVGPTAYGELTVGRSDGHRLIKRDKLTVDHPTGGC